MNKICIFTLYSSIGASSNYRILQYIDDLSEKYKLNYYYFWNDKYIKKYVHNKKRYLISIVGCYLINVVKRIIQLLFVAGKSDIVFFQKGCIPHSKINLINYLKKRGVKIVLDVDDALFLQKGDLTDLVAKSSDLVICGNEVLKAHYQAYCPNTVVIPTVDKTIDYEKHYSDTFEDKTIGWLGSGATINNLDIIVKPLNALINKYNNIRFLIISDSPRNYTDIIKNCEFIEWKKETYLEALSKFTIGVMPLKQTNYNKGKCGFKLVQYLSMKKPAVATDIGVNGEIVGNAGIVVSDEDSWYEAMEQLLFSRDKYNDCIESIEEEFFTKYHYEVISEQLIKLLDMLVK